MRLPLILLTSLFLMSGTLRSEIVAGHELSHAEDLVQEMATKLNRGVVNILTGWGEIPRQMILSGRNRGGWVVLPIGLPAGVIMTVVRTGVGAFETVLFFAPIKDSYGPIIVPAYVWE